MHNHEHHNCCEKDCCHDNHLHGGGNSSCSCGHSHDKDEKSQKITLIRIVVSAILLLIISFLPVDETLKRLLFLIPYFVAGYDILKEAAEGIFNGYIFDENFLMAVATVGAFILGETAEGVFVLIFYQTGELFQSYAVGKSKKNIEKLMDIRPDTAFVEKGGKLVEVRCEDVEIGTEIFVSPGERIPLDGRVLSGNGEIDLSALTGESVPESVSEGESVFSGTVNLTGVLKIKTEKSFSQSTAAKIIELISSANEKKAKSEKFITGFSKVYTPVVCALALILAVIPPLALGGDFKTWVVRALSFLVISCPCALVMSIPMSFFGGIGAGSKNGILIKGSDSLQRMSSVKTVVFDKTGTLTKGSFEVTEIKSTTTEKSELLKYAAYSEAYSSHPLATAIKKSYGEEIDLNKITEAKEIPGFGTAVKAFGKSIAAGNIKLMETFGISFPDESKDASAVYVCIDGKYEGVIYLEDTLKKTTVEAVKQLQHAGIKTVMLTGDNKKIAEKIAEKADIDEVYGELLPKDKLKILDKIIETKKAKTFVAFAGDGINDAPSLARSDVGIAMGSLGSDAAIEGADIVLMDDDLKKIGLSMKISRKTMAIVKQNIVFSIGVKLICLILTALGITNMPVAIFADVGVMVLAVLNSMRTLFTETL